MCSTAKAAQLISDAVGGAVEIEILFVSPSLHLDMRYANGTRSTPHNTTRFPCVLMGTGDIRVSDEWHITAWASGKTVPLYYLPATKFLREI
jgi:hypothetical protein